MSYFFSIKVSRFLLVFLVLAALAGTVWAQGTGELTGLVTDPTGAVIANTKVELTNVQTGLRYDTVTSTAGIYRFAALPVVGTYTLSLSPHGFKAIKVAGIVITVGTITSQDVKLQVGAVAETVTVEAGAEMVQTTESAVSQLVDRRVWQDMPLEVRNQNEFINLAPGAVPQAGTNNNRGAAVNGTREGAGSYLVEGMDNNEQGQAGRGQISAYDPGGAATSISPDAIQEYRVITNSYAAEYGKGGGFITDTVLKSGTNNWHGSLFEYNRIQALAANNFFSNRNNIQDHLVRNQFGGSIGGPIKKDKTFFYGAFEIHRARESYPINAVSTTPEFLNFVKSGAFANWAENSPTGICNNQNWWDGSNNFGNGTPGSSGIVAAPCPGAFSLSKTQGPIFQTLYAKGPYPLANSPQTLTNIGSGFWTNGLAYPVPVYGETYQNDATWQNEARWSVKFDHKFSEKDSISAVYLFQDATYYDQYLGGWNYIGPPYIQDGRGQNAGVTWNHTFSPTVLNNFKIGYLRHVLNFPPPQGYLGIPQYGSYDAMGVDFGLYSGLPQWFTDNQFQFLDNLSFVRGKHNFKTGWEYRRLRNGSTFMNDAYSSVYPWGIEDTVTDLAFSDEVERMAIARGAMSEPTYGSAYYMSAAVNLATGQLPDFYRGFRANELAAFFQDDWRINSRFTVNWGVRWEYFGPPHNFQSGIDSNFYFGTNVTPIVTKSTNPFFPVSSPFYAGVATGQFQIRDNQIWNKDTNNFGPRLGFSWDVLGNQKLVMRAGAGVMYDRIYNNVFENIRFNPPYFSDNQIGGLVNGVPVGAISTPGLFTYPFTSLTMFNNPLYAPKPNPRHMDQNLVTPYYEQVHFGLQYEFANGYVFEPEYVGTFGHKLIGLLDINTFDGRTVSGLGSTRINPNMGADNFRTNGFASNYHSLQMSVRKTYTHGLAFNASYTYSKALDDMSDLFNNRAGAHPTDNMNVAQDYGPADFDLRHRLIATLSYDLPFMKENRWLGGWGVNTIIGVQSGHPFSPYSSSSSYDLNKDGYYTDRVIPVAGVAPMSTVLSSSPANGYFNPDQWQKATCGTLLWCNAPIGRDSMYGPGYQNVDFNVSKKFKVTERSAFTFQANFFNLFNHTNFQEPGYNLNDTATFGKSTAAYAPRITQLALRFDF